MVEKTEDSALLERISTGSKQFYSAGASFSTVTCAAIVLIVWGTMAKFSALFASDACGLGLSFLIVFAYALVIPEPSGYPNAGKQRVTVAEWIFGFINSFIVFSTAAGLKAL
jgi:hypothetical protein